MRILIIEDEEKLLNTIVKSLQKSGYEVDKCSDGNEAIEILEIENFDLVVLDLNLPGCDGMDVLRHFRSHNRQTSVIILSARSQIDDKVEGLDAGANDYMAKPFHLEELEARIRSLTRRKFIQKDKNLSYQGLKFDTINRTTSYKDKIISLTRKERGILEYLLLNLERPISQEELIEHVWDGSVDPFSNSIRVHMSSLRKKLKEAMGFDPIKNKVGLGYQIGGRHE
ncbi:response regulator transcription factor [Peptoniphilus sp. GNH]|nr:response regulator receiver domain protein [Clostridiales bacterium KA00134]UHR02635.1 response regulator transcription factor [Peptoniphilus sp. GNH]